MRWWNRGRSSPTDRTTWRSVKILPDTLTASSKGPGPRTSPSSRRRASDSSSTSRRPVPSGSPFRNRFSCESTRSSSNARARPTRPASRDTGPGRGSRGAEDELRRVARARQRGQLVRAALGFARHRRGWRSASTGFLLLAVLTVLTGGCVSTPRVIAVPTLHKEPFWGYTAPSLTGTRELVITTEYRECDIARTAHARAGFLYLSPADCRPLTIGVGASVFWIVPAV